MFVFQKSQTIHPPDLSSFIARALSITNLIIYLYIQLLMSISQQSVAHLPLCKFFHASVAIENQQFTQSPLAQCVIFDKGI